LLQALNNIEAAKRAINERVNNFMWVSCSMENEMAIASGSKARCEPRLNTFRARHSPATLPIYLTGINFIWLFSLRKIALLANFCPD
jgi:hypothetical protein